MKNKFMKFALILVLSQAILYVWVATYWSYRVGTEVSPMLSVAFLGFCGFEAGICGYLKGKDKNDHNDDLAA